ncbi:carboxypeptidase regulatory-like domain-containing protein [Xanthomonas arboricola]|uniref:carboxypeptidase regulatory-like domain-containing protein n=1 Tax=Xanthomonas arboricola TaxID=56448 RepID=UPI000E0F2F74|nr:carboxypeptidase regulatory-like domain-containing protein [Xanthomonas arboricola]
MTLALPWLVGSALLLLVMLSWFRLLRAHARQPRTRARLWLLLAAQPLLAGLLYPVLLPPPRAGSASELHVATAGTQADQVRPTAAPWVALPEAPALPGVARVPDLATALRRAPGTTTLVVHGSGLPARDRDGLRVPVRLALAPLPTGLVAVSTPPPVAPGERIAISARVQGLPGARVELLDPAGQVADTAAADAAGQVQLRGLARAQGQLLFALRLRDGAGAERSRVPVPVPVLIAAVPSARVLLLAGAPQPELKYLRRWASDAGMQVRSQIAVGPGVQLGEGAALDAASLDALDLLVIDQRRLVALGNAQRQGVRAAIGRGLGVLVRTDGPLDAAVRAALGELGLAVTGGSTSAAVPAPRSLASPGASDAAAAPADAAPLPPLQRRTLQPQQADAVIAARADDGSALGWWRPQGRGRIGIGLIEDSFALVLAGRSDLHAALWAQLVSAVARAGGNASAAVQTGWSQHRMTLCGVAADAAVIGPTGASQALLIDPASGARACAAYWPTTAGWHRLQTGTEQRWLYVRAPGDAPALHTQQIRDATVAMAAVDAPASVGAPTAQPGARWPWLLAWLTLAAALWWLERRRR